MFLRRSLLFALLALTLVAPAHAQIYVDADNTAGTQDGQSWGTAYDNLQAALGDATGSDEIWIAEGVYYPDEGPGIADADADTTFYIDGDQDGLTLYGGFEGTETDADERAPQEHRVILSADIGQDDTDPDGDNVIEDAADVNGDNSKQVMVLDGTVGGGITRSTLISGVVMTAGRARGPDPRAQSGGGLYCAGGAPGAECSPRLHGIVFAGNATTVAKGGALYNDGFFGTAEPYVENAVFVGNSAPSEGGGAVHTTGITDDGTAHLTLVNAVFVGNSVKNSGGAIHNNGGTVEITGATFTGNTAGAYGGAIHNTGTNGNQGTVTVVNSILWGNSDTEDGDEVRNSFNMNMTFAYTIVEGGTGGISNDGSIDYRDASGASVSFANSTNEDSNPQYVNEANPDGPDGVFRTRDDGLTGRFDSPVFDAGGNGAIPAAVSTDITGADRTQNRELGASPTVDLGAYEAPTIRTQVYVDADATGTRTGASWDDAFTDLRTALRHAGPITELWVAEGFYTPGLASKSFRITGRKDGLNLYGGFEGTEASLSERAPREHRTILSGDIEGNDIDEDGDGIVEDADPNDKVKPEHLIGENAGPVLDLFGQSAPITTATVIDGVTVTAGDASDGGGGLRCDANGIECSPTLRNVVFAGNWAGARGGAVQSAGGSGGKASPEITNAVFVGNASPQGGAFFSDVDGSGTASPAITNAVFAENTAQIGGAIHVGAGNVSLVNATVTGNNATSDGGGLHLNGGGAVANTVFWDNSADGAGDEVNNEASTVSFSHTIVQGGSNGVAGSGPSEYLAEDGSAAGSFANSTNLDQDPQFTDPSTPAGTDGVFATRDDGLTGADGSPIFDAGDDDVLPSGVSTDVTGADRTQSRDQGGTATVDLGAYEAGPAATPAAITGAGFGGLDRSFSAASGEADQPVGVVRLTPDRDVASLTGLTLTPNAVGAAGVDRVALWRSTDDQFDPGTDTELTGTSTDPQAGLPSTLTLDGFTEDLPAEARYLFVTVTLTDQAEGGVTFYVASESDLGLQNGFIDHVNGNDQSGFSTLALSSGSAPLPVELASFDGRATEGGVRLRWETASEQDNVGFRILRKIGTTSKRSNRNSDEPSRRDGSTEGWQTIGRREGVGTTSDVQRYRFTDDDLPYAADSVSYRLRQVDTDGTTHLTDPVTVARSGPEGLELLGTVPNPVVQRATVRYGVPESVDSTVRLRLYDVLGRRVRTVAARAEAGRHERALDVGGLSSGMYVLRLSAGGQSVTRKLTVVQ